MRRYIDQGATPNRAAVLVANEHWRTTPSRTWEACVAWLKRNEREHRDKLQRLQQRDPQLARKTEGLLTEEVLAQLLRRYDRLTQRFAQHQRRASSSRRS
jgi:hypothetical protein